MKKKFVAFVMSLMLGVANIPVSTMGKEINLNQSMTLEKLQQRNIQGVVDVEDKDLLLWYSFDQVNGNSILDASKNKYNAEFVGDVSFKKGIDGNGIQLDGGYVQLPNGIFDNQNHLTISMMIKSDVEGNYFAFGVGQNDQKYMFMNPNRWGEAKFGISVESWRNEQVVYTQSPKAKVEWVSLVVTLEDNVLKLYKDGELVSTKDNSTVKVSDLGTNLKAYIGKSFYSADPNFKGAIDDFIVYTRALDAEEIADLTAGMIESRDSIVLEADAATLNLTHLDAVTTNLSLPTQGVSGSKISWKSDKPEYISAAGVVTRPIKGEEDQVVTLEATLEKGSAKVYKTFVANVIAEPSDDKKVEEDYNALDLGNDLKQLTHYLKLPSKGANGSQITWASTDELVITNEGIITRDEAENKSAVLTATIKSGDVQQTKSFEVTVLAQEENTAYLFSYFTGNNVEGERTRLAVSKDGYNFEALNFGNPIISQMLGSGCARDPYILRGEDGYFYLLATDLKSSSGWNNENLITWKSRDLITWEEETIIPMADFYPGDFISSKSWAPHAMWDEARGEYMLYWAADHQLEGTNTTKLGMWYAYTKDFKTLTTEPALLFAPHSGNDALDADIFFDGETYHMYYKDGGHDSGIKKTTSTNLSGPYGPESELLTIGGVEGPALYQFIGEDKWMLIYDIYTTGKYAASVTTDLENFTRIDDNMVNLNTLTPRHGSILQVTEREYANLQKTYGNMVPDVEEKEEPIVHYTFDEDNGMVAIDQSGSGKDAVLYGGTSFIQGKNGADDQALQFDGKNGYALLPNNIIKETVDLTIATWVKIDEVKKQQRIFDFGEDTSRYLFFSVTGSNSCPTVGVRANGKEEFVQSSTDVPTDTWMHMALTMDNGVGRIYVNGVEVAQSSKINNLPYTLGSTTKNYLGRSVWSADPYFKGALDDFRIYNRALGSGEIAALAEVEGTEVLSVGAGDAKIITTLKDSEAGTIKVAIKKLDAIDFTALPISVDVVEGSNVSPASGSVVDATKPIVYTVTDTEGNSKIWTVEVIQTNNPVLDGLYADPDIMIYNGKYYIYPTSDGHNGWSGTYFKVFSSENLIDWEDHGQILDVASDAVPWATGNAWAPAIIEKDDKFYFFYCASQQVGVAVADSPIGPFKNLSINGPLVPASVLSANGGGQAIDPDIFKDEDGKYYIYVGNGNAVVAELNIDGDIVEIASPWTKITPPGGEFREALHVMKRNGVYHFTWSVDDTRSENYRLRYGTSTSPLGPIQVESGVLLQKDKELSILGTGHHTILEIPERDEYYMVYHRFAQPAPVGVSGDARGYNREVCIDKLTFDEVTGKMQKVIPTLEGIIEPVYLPGFEPEQKPDSPVVSMKTVDSVKEGETFEVRIGVNGMNEPVYSQDITINYDAEKFTLVSEQAIQPTMIVGTDDSSEGSVRLLLATENGLLAGREGIKLTFRAKDTKEETTGTITTDNVLFGIIDTIQETAEVVEADNADIVVTITPDVEIPEINRQELDKAIEEAEKLSNEAVVGDKPGQYPQAAKYEFEQAIVVAKGIAQTSQNQEEIDNATIVLRRAINTFKGLQVQRQLEDINEDGTVDVADLALVAYYYHQEVNSENSKADINRDGTIDIQDLSAVASKMLEMKK